MLKMPVVNKEASALVAAGGDDALLRGRIHVRFSSIIQYRAHVLLLQAIDRALNRGARRATAKVVEEGVANDDIERETVAQDRSKVDIVT